jgi:hypothetical protein
MWLPALAVSLKTSIGSSMCHVLSFELKPLNCELHADNLSIHLKINTAHLHFEYQLDDDYYYENHTKHMIILCEQNAKLLKC